MIGSTWLTTVQSEGTRTSMPPHIANTSRVGSADALMLAPRRSISQRPMKEVTLPPRKSCELLRFSTLPRMAIADTTEFEDAVLERASLSRASLSRVSLSFVLSASTRWSVKPALLSNPGGGGGGGGEVGGE